MDKKSKVEERVQELISPIIESAGYSLYDILYAKEHQEWYLRVFIDSDNGIELTDCEKIHYLISEPLDQLDPIPQGYFLEISSPGIERLLRNKQHFIDNIGSKIYVKLYKPIDKVKEFTGVLNEVNEENIVLDCDGNIINLSFTDIAKANVSVF